MNRKNTPNIILIAALALGIIISGGCSSGRKMVYTSYQRSTPNIGKGVNEVRGIVLHHTASPSLQSAYNTLTSPEREVSCHVIIDRDGTRYLLAAPEAITWHAGYSSLHGREKCNEFTIGIEFQGNTLKKPLTKKQIRSAISYMLPIIDKYGIPLENIVTHEMVRTEFKRNNPGRKVPGKVDITQKEYRKVMKALNDSLRVRDLKNQGRRGVH